MIQPGGRKESTLVTYSRQKEFASVRSITDGIRTLRLGDANGILQPVHGNIDANRVDIDGVWQTECGAGIQPVHGIVWRNSPRFEPDGAMGTIVRLAGKQVRHDTTLLNGQMERWLRPRGRRAGKAMRHRARREIPTRVKIRVAICMRDTTGMCTKTQVRDGRNPTGMEAGQL